ncbi:MAG: Na/Pi cotransporter family protein [Erysipelotrichaceae bacterium]|nr:Na/Pi cotransporter family protein [Erysipelotrichaceae bacterium]
MDLYSMLQVIAGLSFFLYGMSVMSSSLEKMAGGKLEASMKKVTSNKVMSFLLGALITIAIQSSSGAMVMLVGLVNSGIIEYSKTLPIILGSNVGTTFTGWLLSLTSVGGGEFSILSLLNPKYFSPILAFVGILLKMTGKNEKKKDIGIMLLGFAILMYGMNFMSDSMKLIADEPWFADMLVMFTNPLLALLVSALFTGLIQSSAATIGIVEAFALSGTMTYQMAIPLVLGANIGTCITGVIGAIGTNRNAQRVAVMQVLVNTLSAMFVLIVQILMNIVHADAILLTLATSFSVAMIHTVFNIFNTLVSFLLEKQIISLSKKFVRETPEEVRVFIDERLLSRPAIAVRECLSKTKEMVSMAKDDLQLSLKLLTDYDEKDYEFIRKTENDIDWYEDELDTFLVKLSRMELSEDDSKISSKCLHVITDVERIGDHALNIADIAKKLHDENKSFSDEAMVELRNMITALSEIVDFASRSFVEDDLASSAQVEPLEEVIDVMADDMMDSHVKRVVEGSCTIKEGFDWSDIINNCERVSDHCSNIAVAVIEVSDDEFYTHQYLHDLKHDSDAFKALYQYYSDKYLHPETKNV